MTCTRHTQPFNGCMRTRTALVRCNARDTVVAEEVGKAVWEGRQAGQQGGVAGLVMAGRVGWWGRWDGWSGRRGMDLQCKECSGVNVVT